MANIGMEYKRKKIEKLRLTKHISIKINQVFVNIF